MRLVWTAVSALSIALLASSGARANQCKPIDTTIATYFLMPDDCQSSPVLLCTEGTVSSGRLEGTTRFNALTIAPGPENLLLYTGELVITTKSGTLTLRDSGFLDTATGRYFETQNVVGGTKAFKHATGMLTSQGTFDGMAFKGTLTGALCNGKHDLEAAAEAADDDFVDQVDPSDELIDPQIAAG
jgi:hypothetical protein